MIINTPDNFVLPQMRPVRIITEPKNKLTAIWLWLTYKRSFEITEDYYFKMTWLPDQPIIKIPSGFIFNGASIPRPFWSFLTPTGILFLPALFHDFGYTYDTWMTLEGNVCAGAEGQEFFDDQFREISKIINGLPILSGIAWWILRKFGGFAWDKNREFDFAVAIA